MGSFNFLTQKIMTERINQTPETNNKDSKWLRNTTKITGSALAAALLALNIQFWDWKNLENWQVVSIPESKVLEQVEREWIWDRTLAWIKSMLAKWLDFVIPPAHAWDDIAEDDSMQEQYEESQQELKQTREETQQAQERAEATQAEAQQAHETRIEYTNEMISLVNQLWIEFDGELEEKRNEIVKYWTQENLSNEKVRELNSHLDDILDYINSNY